MLKQEKNLENIFFYRIMKTCDNDLPISDVSHRKSPNSG